MASTAAPAEDPIILNAEVVAPCALCDWVGRAIVPDYMVTETIAALRKEHVRHWGEKHPGEERR